MHSFPGSKWWSFDFHNHTPASSDYDGAERGALSPRDWLLAYMRAGVDCVAVTDHNTGDWIDRLQVELSVMGREDPKPQGFRALHLFPGVELTTAEGLHVLAIFGPTDGTAKVYGVLALSRCNTHQYNAERICAEGAVSICGHIHAQGGVAILAHAEKINGIFEGDLEPATGRFNPKRGGREIDQVLAVCDGIEVHALNHPALAHFADSAARFALLDGSDAHRSANAGTRTVWLKMATPSIDGLKLALSDPSSAVTRDRTRIAAPPLRISSLSIEGLQLRRQRLEVQFSPWFNSVIGGRGSGKSTLLESLRLATARDSEVQELGAESDVRRSFDRFRQVGGARGSAGMVRSNTVIRTVVEKHDAGTGATERYQFQWTPTAFEATRWDDGGSWSATGLTAEQAAALFAVKVFSQKQVFELAERPSALLTYIDSSPEVDLQSWKDENERLRRQLRERRSEERALKQALSKKPQIETELKEAIRKTTAYQQSPVAQQVKVFSENQQAQRAIADFDTALKDPVAALKAVVDRGNPYTNLKLGSIDVQRPDPASVRQVSEGVVTELARHYDTLIAAVEGLQQSAVAFRNAPEVMAFSAELDAGMAAYRSEVERLKAQGVGTAEEAEAALQRKQALEVAFGRLLENEARLTTVQRSVRRAYVALTRHRHLLTERRVRFVDGVLVSNPRLRITIEGQADVAASAAEFRAALRLQEGTFVEDIYTPDGGENGPTGLLSKLVAEDLPKPVHKRVTSLKVGIIERSQQVLGQRMSGRLTNAIARLNPDDDDTLLEWFPHDRVTVQFRRSDAGGFQSLEHASAGQKTSAILSFLLAHGDEPLLLDQPEDDLDNALISELVVEQIRAHKPRRQIVVVTHNPNIVVNGDAELVVPMDFAGGQIQVKDAGGLQDKAVRQRICDVMEGGKEAFRQRYKRILSGLDS